MKTCRTPLLALIAVACWLAAPARAAQNRTTGIVAQDAPVMLLPETGRTPLATLRAGTVVQVLDSDEEGWYRISFQDSYLLGDRIGYIRAEHLKVSTVRPPAGGILTAPAPSGPSGAPRFPSRGGLEEARIAAAVAAGQQPGGRAPGLRLTAPGQLRLLLHTPLSWIQQLSSDAAKEKRRFTSDDVTGEMAEPVLRVTVSIDTRDIAAARGMNGTSGVRHAVLRGETSGEVVEPVSKKAYSEHVLAAGGGRAVFQGLSLTFPMDALRRLRGAGNVILGVTAASGAQTLIRLEERHFAELPM